MMPGFRLARDCHLADRRVIGDPGRQVFDRHAEYSTQYSALAETEFQHRKCERTWCWNSRFAGY